jgi:hypothetical protein
MNARNGKIARLPRPVREELNERLERSAESPGLLQWLNGLPEVKTLLETARITLAGPQNSEEVTVGNAG